MLNNENYDRRVKIFEFKLQPGCRDGTKITFEKEGDRYYGKIPSDIIFKIKVKPHQYFTVEKSNLIVTKDIDLLQALKSNINLNLVVLRIVCVYLFFGFFWLLLKCPPLHGRGQDQF